MRGEPRRPGRTKRSPRNPEALLARSGTCLRSRRPGGRSTSGPISSLSGRCSTKWLRESAPGSAAPAAPAALRWIVDRCLAKDPEDRYASTRDLARDLATLKDHLSEASGVDL